MSLPSIGLTPLTMLSPTLPAGVTTVSVDATVLALSILADVNTIAIDVVIEGVTTTMTTFTAVAAGGLLFTGAVSLPGDSAVVEITGRNYNTQTGATSQLLTPTISFTLLPVVSDYSIIFGPPSGVTSAKTPTIARVEWAMPTYIGFQGVLVEWSTDSTGVTVPYQTFGDPVADVSRSAQVAVNLVDATATSLNSDGTTNSVETKTTTLATVNYSNVEIPYSTVNADLFYVRLSTIVYDASTNLSYQSQYAGPILAGFVNLGSVQPSDFLALQRASDIAARMIAEVTRREPSLDLTARSELRDLDINPIALELANLSVREWFSRCCSSITALMQIDDADGDGISDPYASSTVKQQIARAYGLSATSVQTFIDQRFDVYGQRAGVERGGATTATADVLFFTYQQPKSALTIGYGATVSTQASATSDSVVFTTTASGVIDPNGSYDPSNGWWATTVPAIAAVSGSAGQVGAGMINRPNAGVPSGVAVVNLFPSENGTDEQSNSDYASVMLEYAVTGKDTSSRGGLSRLAQSIPGVTDVNVVGAGDLEMLRDWDPVRQKHINGCVDIYLRGDTISQATQQVPFVWPSTSIYGTLSTYVKLTLTDPTNLRFQIAGFDVLDPLYTVVEIIATNVAGSIYLGTANAQIDNTDGLVILDPTEYAYQVNADGSTSVWQINGVNTTNVMLLQALSSQGSATFSMMARGKEGITLVPTLQPVLAVGGVTGPVTGSLPTALVQLSRTNDFLLTGGSNAAGDTVSVALTSQLQTQTLTLVGTSVQIDTDMDLTVSSLGTIGNVLSVRSSDLSTLYVYGSDYTVVATGRYRSYAIKTLTNASTGLPCIPAGTVLVVAYYKFPLTETVTLQTDTLLLSGTATTPLSQAGFVYNTWLPSTHGRTDLLLDGYNSNALLATGLIGAGVLPAMRYIKVVYGTAVMVEGRDFALVVNVFTGAATLARVLGGSIPDGASVTVTYFYNEVFTVTTQYPTYVQQLITALQPVAAAGADILVKAMVANPVDITLLVELDDNTLASTADPAIRTVLSRVLDTANTKLNQATIVKQVLSITGITNVQVPLIKCAKSDGSYSIGEVIPTGTTWTPLASDSNFASLVLPSDCYISGSVLLENATIPSGGQVNAYVGMLYQGEAYRRAYSVTDFLTSGVPSFYIIGTNDRISATTPLDSTYPGKILVKIPSIVASPGLLSFFVTYQVYGEGGASDITCSSTEFLEAGTVQVLYSEGS